MWTRSAERLLLPNGLWELVKHKNLYIYTSLFHWSVSRAYKNLTNTEKQRESSLMQLLAACGAETGSLGFYRSYGRDVSLADEPRVSLHPATA